jgi:hypothetical protein
VRRIAQLALLFPLLAAGCGGGSGEKTTTAVETRPDAGLPQSKADYVELADAICHNHQSRREDLESQARDLGPLTSKDKAHQIADLLRQESSNRRAEIGELNDLQPPDADAPEVNSILSLLRSEADVLDTWAAAYDDLDAPAIRRQQIRLGVTAGRAADRARAYGFEVCGQQ